MLSEISHTEKTNSTRNHQIVESKTKTNKQKQHKLREIRGLVTSI